MTNIFLSSGLCDSFVNGELETTLPQALDIKQPMGVNLTELSCDEFANVPACNYTVEGREYRMPAGNCMELEQLLEELTNAKRGYRFERTMTGSVKAVFPKRPTAVMRIPQELAEITGFDEIIRDGDETTNWDLFAYVPYMLAVLDVAEKTAVGNSSFKALRMVPGSYKKGDTYFQFIAQNFVSIIPGEICKLRFKLVSKHGNVQFLRGGTLQAAIQLSPVTKKLLV